MIIEVSKEPCVVIKHYKVRVVLHTTYDVFLIHNETTGEIRMTSDGISMNSYKACFDDVVKTFKKQMSLPTHEKKYRLGNQPEEYELVTKYLGWTPEKELDWDNVFPMLSSISETKGKKVTIVNGQKDSRVNLIIDHRIIKDAFPMEFYGEERADNWCQFCIVSTEDLPEEKFIIPLH